MNKINTLIGKLINYELLTTLEAEEAMSVIIRGGANPIEIATYLTALKMQEIDSKQITGCLNYFSRVISPQAINKDVYSLSFPSSSPFIKAAEIIISLILSSFRVSIIKNLPSILPLSSEIADLKSVGYNFDLTSAQIIKIIRSNNIVFTESKNFYPKMIDCNYTRDALKFNTIFDIIAPFIQQIDTKCAILAAPNYKYAIAIANSLKNLSYNHVIIFYNNDNITSMCPGINNVIYLSNNNLSESKLLLPYNVNINFAELNNLELQKQNSLFFNNQQNLNEFVCYNSAAILFVLKIFPSFEKAFDSTKCIFVEKKIHNILSNLVGATNNFV